ncbi:MAG: succinylglutamate desuccinylase [Cognaticolwellia sp.]|jgi:succinylglutamate desuccinylase
MSELNALLTRFAGLCPSSASLPPFVAQAGDGGGFHVVLCCMTHGDETGSLPAAIQLLDALRQGTRRFAGRLTVVVGNPPAARLGRRFGEADLNRVFLPGPQSWERRRAAELMPILDQADLVVDLHQTIEPTALPFHIHPWTPLLEHWAQILQGAQDWVTRPMGESFATGTCCLDEYVRDQGRAALTIELSQKGMRPQTTQLALAVMERALDAAEAMLAGKDLALLTRSAKEMRLWRTAHKEPYASAALRLRNGLRNFEPVQAGELLSAVGTPELRAPCSGALLFPKYPPRNASGELQGPLPVDIFHVLTPLSQHPSALGWPTGAP